MYPPWGRACRVVQTSRDSSQRHGAGGDKPRPYIRGSGGAAPSASAPSAAVIASAAWRSRCLTPRLLRRLTAPRKDMGRAGVIAWADAVSRGYHSVQKEPGLHRSSLNRLMLSPESFTIPAMVNASTGSARGIVMICSPSVIVTCPPCRAIQNPAFSKALIAR